LEVFLVYATKEVAIVVPDDSDIANGIELTAGMCKWDTGVAVPMERHYKTTGPYKSRGLHLCPVPPNAMKILRQAPPAGVAACVNFWMSFSLPHSFFSQIMRVAFRQEGIQQRVCSHGLRPEQVGFVPVVEATKAMYIENELMRDTTLSPLRTALPWLEYHLKHGVSRHILHVSLPAEQSEAAALKQFWLEMYAPYLTGGEVILVLHHGRDRKPSGGGVGEGGAGYQFTDHMVSLWLAKGWAEWIGFHDFDEYVIPMATAGNKAGEFIPSILAEYPSDVHAVTTRMYDVQVPTNSKIYLSSIRANSEPQGGFDKVYARVAKAKVAWVHAIADWGVDGPGRAEPKQDMAIHHYSTNHFHEGPTVHDSPRLDDEHDDILLRLHKRLGVDHGEYLHQIKSKFEGTIAALREQDVDGE
jgi:hypothetical protein